VNLKVLVNLSALAYAEYVSIYMVDGWRMCSSLHGRQPRLVVRSYNSRDGLDDEERYSLSIDDSSTLTAPWGYGLVGYVAETGVVVRVDSKASSAVSNFHFICH